MFTLKFFNGADSIVTCGKKYAIEFKYHDLEDTKPTEALIHVYDKVVDDEGFTFHVGGEIGFGVCYIENEIGKTIHKVIIN